MRICWFYVTLKIGLSSIERIYLIYGILENPKTCLYGNKTDDVSETNPIIVIFSIVQRWKSLEHWLNIQVSSSVGKWYTSIAMKKGFGIAWSSRPAVFSKKSVLENFAKSTGKHLYQRPFFSKSLKKI